MADPFTDSKLAAITDVLEHARRSYKNHGTREATHRTALAMYAIGEDVPWRMPTEFKHLQAVKQFGKLCHDRAVESGNVFTETGESQSYAGIIIDPMERTLTFDDTAVAVLREEGSDFPEVGIYVPYATAARMVELALLNAGALTGDGDASQASSAPETPDSDGSDGTATDGDDITDPVPLATNLEVHTKAELIEMYDPEGVDVTSTKTKIIDAIIAQWPLPKVIEE